MTQKQQFKRLFSAFRMSKHYGRLGFGPMELAWVGITNDVVNAVVRSQASDVMPYAPYSFGTRWSAYFYRRQHAALPSRLP